MEKYPVYFSFEDEDLDKVLADIKRNDAAGPATATTGGFCSFLNIQGWLPGSKPDGDSNQLPTIAIVASYDTFGAAPVVYPSNLMEGVVNQACSHDLDKMQEHHRVVVVVVCGSVSFSSSAELALGSYICALEKNLVTLP
ncbi:nicalin-1-like protein isoform X2 [Tanacetum coccineum]